MRTLALLAFLALVMVGCTCSPEPLEFVRCESGANVSLSLASSASNHPATTITVTIDDALVASQPLEELLKAPKHYRLKISPGHHELIARANTGRTKEVFPIFIQEQTERLTLTYQCACDGADHDGRAMHFKLEQ